MIDDRKEWTAGEWLMLFILKTQNTSCKSCLSRIEPTVAKLKRLSRIALCCEKTRRSFASIVAPAVVFTLIKYVYTA